MTKAKKRFIAYVFAMLSCIFITLYFLVGQDDYSNNNWFYKGYPEDPVTFKYFEKDVSYKIESDAALSRIYIKYDNSDTITGVFTFDEYHTRRTFSLSVDKPSRIGFSFYESGIFFKYFIWEIHKNMTAEHCLSYFFGWK